MVHYMVHYIVHHIVHCLVHCIVHHIVHHKCINGALHLAQAALPTDGTDDLEFVLRDDGGVRLLYRSATRQAALCNAPCNALSNAVWHAPCSALLRSAKRQARKALGQVWGGQDRRERL